MRRPQLGRLQDRRTERVLRRSHADDVPTPQIADDVGRALPIRGGVLRADDGQLVAGTTRTASSVSDAA